MAFPRVHANYRGPHSSHVPFLKSTAWYQRGKKKKKKTPNMAEKSRHPLLLSSWRDLETGEEILPGPPAHPESQPLDPGSADS